MRNLQTEASVSEGFIEAGWSPDAVLGWVARPLAVQQIEQAQAAKEQAEAVQKQVVPEEDHPQQP